MHTIHFLLACFMTFMKVYSRFRWFVAEFSNARMCGDIGYTASHTYFASTQLSGKKHLNEAKSTRIPQRFECHVPTYTEIRGGHAICIHVRGPFSSWYFGLVLVTALAVWMWTSNNWFVDLSGSGCVCVWMDAYTYTKWVWAHVQPTRPD